MFSEEVVLLPKSERIFIRSSWRKKQVYTCTISPGSRPCNRASRAFSGLSLGLSTLGRVQKYRPYCIRTHTFLGGFARCFFFCRPIIPCQAKTGNWSLQTITPYLLYIQSMLGALQIPLNHHVSTFFLIKYDPHISIISPNWLYTLNSTPVYHHIPNNVFWSGHRALRSFMACWKIPNGLPGFSQLLWWTEDTDL